MNNMPQQKVVGMDTVYALRMTQQTLRNLQGVSAVAVINKFDAVQQQRLAQQPTS